MRFTYWHHKIRNGSQNKSVVTQLDNNFGVKNDMPYFSDRLKLILKKNVFIQ